MKENGESARAKQRVKCDGAEWQSDVMEEAHARRESCVFFILSFIFFEGVTPRFWKTKVMLVPVEQVRKMYILLKPFFSSFRECLPPLSPDGELSLAPTLTLTPLYLQSPLLNVLSFPLARFSQASDAPNRQR